MNNYSNKQKGLSYIELILAVILIAISIAPIHSSLNSSLRSYDHSQEIVDDALHVSNLLEQLTNEKYAQLYQKALNAGSHTIATSYSDPPTVANRRLVYLSLWDGDDADSDNDGHTGADAGLLWIKVELEKNNYYIETLIDEK